MSDVQPTVRVILTAVTLAIALTSCESGSTGEDGSGSTTAAGSESSSTTVVSAASLPTDSEPIADAPPSTIDASDVMASLGPPPEGFCHWWAEDALAMSADNYILADGMEFGAPVVRESGTDEQTVDWTVTLTNPSPIRGRTPAQLYFTVGEWTAGEGWRQSWTSLDRAAAEQLSRVLVGTNTETGNVGLIAGEDRDGRFEVPLDGCSAMLEHGFVDIAAQMGRSWATLDLLIEAAAAPEGEVLDEYYETRTTGGVDGPVIFRGYSNDGSGFGSMAIEGVLVLDDDCLKLAIGGPDGPRSHPILWESGTRWEPDSHSVAFAGYTFAVGDTFQHSGDVVPWESAARTLSDPTAIARVTECGGPHAEFSVVFVGS